MTEWLGYGSFVAVLTVMFIGWVPVIGSALGMLGAVFVWQWEWWQAALLMFGHFIVLPTVIIFGMAGAAVLEWLHPRAKSRKT